MFPASILYPTETPIHEEVTCREAQYCEELFDIVLLLLLLLLLFLFLFLFLLWVFFWYIRWVAEDAVPE